MSQTSDFGGDRVDLAHKGEHYLTELEITRSQQPMSYMVLFEKDGIQSTVTFECERRERAITMREHGIDPDNVRHALKNRGSDGRWAEPIGDDELCTLLKRKR